MQVDCFLVPAVQQLGSIARQSVSH